MISEEKYADPVQHNTERRDSKLRRAVTFFKHLGLKSCSRHKDPGPSSAGDYKSHDIWLANRHRYEMEDTFCAELEAIEVENVFEMDSTEANTTQDLDYLPRYTQTPDVPFQRSELDVEPLILDLRSDGKNANPADPFMDIRARLEAAQHGAVPLGEMPESPASTIGVPISHQNTEHIPSLDADVGSAGPAYLSPDIVRSPEVVDYYCYHASISTTHSRPTVASEEEGSLCEGTASSAYSQIYELDDTVRVFNAELLSRCQSTPRIVQRASAFSSRCLSDMGAQALRLIIKGGQPETFDAVLALAHIACAVAYIVHRPDGSHCWNKILRDIHQLQHLILDENDAVVFSQLMDMLLWPQGFSAKQSCGTHFLNEDLQAPCFPKKSALMHNQPSLKDGLLVQQCLAFLDGKLIHPHSFVKTCLTHICRIRVCHHPG